MRLDNDPMALDPLSPIRIKRTADLDSTDPMALDPLSPLPWRARAIDAQAGQWTRTTESEIS
jgi:hypothetical protein